MKTVCPPMWLNKDFTCESEEIELKNKDVKRRSHSQEKKVQKLSLGLYLFKRYAFVSKGCILVP